MSSSDESPGLLLSIRSRARAANPYCSHSCIAASPTTYLRASSSPLAITYTLATIFQCRLIAIEISSSRAIDQRKLQDCEVAMYCCFSH